MKKQEMRDEAIVIQITGYELQEMALKLMKEKLGAVEINYLELCSDKIKNKHILNDDDNSFTIFVEYKR